MTSSINFSVLLLFLNILLASTQRHNFTFLVSGGYRPSEHTLVKHAVSLRLKSELHFGTTHFCGGAIISPRIILTAAHCLWKSKKTRNSADIQIVAATPNRLVKSPETQIIGVKNIILHPQYDYKTSFNDIGILHLISSIYEDGVHAQKIELPDSPAEVGMECTVVGWGSLFALGPGAADALYADIYILNGLLCKFIYYPFLDGMLCAADPFDLEKDSCRGDSGGPLICESKVYGIVSFGIGCGIMPGAYTDVWYYRDWVMRGGKGRSVSKVMNVLLLTLLVWIVI